MAFIVGLRGKEFNNSSSGSQQNGQEKEVNNIYFITSRWDTP
ncbi:MAG: hypothetical protein ABWW69_02230 [Pyrodictiaceae archaeon]